MLFLGLIQFSSRNMVALQPGRCTAGGLRLVERKKVSKDHVRSRTETVYEVWPKPIYKNLLASTFLDMYVHLPEIN